jgi:hypothetical protein
MKHLLLIQIFLVIQLVGCEHIEVVNTPEVVNEVVKPMQFNECLKAFNNNEHKRKAPPLQFIKDLYVWIKVAPEFLYARNSEPRDAFSHLSSYLGINKDSTLKYRQAALFELMRVSAAMESSFNWQQGRDKAAQNYDWYTQEAGMFQTSPNSHVYAHKGWGRWEYLDKLVAKHGVGLVKQGSPNNELWNKLMKDESKKHVIFEHHAFMLRHNFRHYGPVIDPRRVGMNINKQCIKEVESFL